MRCARWLVARGHSLATVASDDPRVLEWAEQEALPACRPSSLEQAWHACDVLLSIAHDRRIPSDWLERPRLAAINFHDGPLPRYAGLYATSWAIIDRQPMHAVSWHHLRAELDTGEVIVQRAVPILPDATAFSLDLDCHEAAVQSFAELVRALETGDAAGQPQDLAARSYHGRDDQPDGAGLLAWQHPARMLAAMVRGLDFGPRVNPITLPKVRLANASLVCRRAEELPHAVDEAPGTLLDVGTGALTVATGCGALRIDGLAPLGGGRAGQPIASVLSDLAPGLRLPVLEAPALAAIASLARRLQRHAEFWRERLACAVTLELPVYRHSLDAGSADLGQEHADVALSARASAWLGADPVPHLLTAAGTFLSRLSGQRVFDLLVELPEVRELSAGNEDLFATRVPFRFDLAGELTLEAAVPTVRRELAQLQQRLTFARDLPLRDPTRCEALLQQLARLGACAIAVASEGELRGAELVIGQGATATSVRWSWERARFDTGVMRGLAACFARYLDAALATPSPPHARVELAPGRPPSRPPRCAHGPTGEEVSGLLTAQAERNPGAVALVSSRRELSYAELRQRSRQLADTLLERGVGPEERVGILLGQSLEQVIAVWAVLEARGAYVPLDPRLPTARLEQIVRSSRLRFVLTHTDHVERLSCLPVEAICLGLQPQPLEAAAPR